MIDDDGTDMLDLSRDRLSEGASEFQVLGVVRVPDGFPKAVIECIAIDDDLPRMDCFNGAERDGEVTDTLDVDDQLRPAVWRNLVDSSKGFVSAGDEDLETFLDLLILYH
jgi:hypothetical protein